MAGAPSIAVVPPIASADWSLQVGAGPADGSEIGNVVQGVADVEQCIAIIFSTPRGSDILRPTFGCDLFKYVDRPINTAIPRIVRDATAALTLWEPRITLVSIIAAPVLDGSSQNGAKLIVTVTYTLKLTGATRTARVPIGALPLIPLGAGI
jgi:uncharacterized protein